MKILEIKCFLQKRQVLIDNRNLILLTCYNFVKIFLKLCQFTRTPMTNLNVSFWIRFFFICSIYIYLYQYSASDWKSSTKNEWAYSDYIFPYLYITHNSYGPKINSIYFVNKCFKKAAYLLKEYIHIRKKKSVIFWLHIFFNENRF